MYVNFDDPCASATITEPDAGDITYVITDPAEDFALTPPFSVNPSYCATSITNAVTGGEITVEFDEPTQTITVPENTSDLGPSRRDPATTNTEEPYEVCTTYTVTP